MPSQAFYGDLVRALNGDPDLLISDFSSSDLEEAAESFILNLHYPSLVEEIKNELEERKK